VSSILVFCLVGKGKPRGLSSLAQRKSKMFPYGFNWTESEHSFRLAAVHSDHIIIQNPNPKIMQNQTAAAFLIYYTKVSLYIYIHSQNVPVPAYKIMQMLEPRRKNLPKKFTQILL
jgi:hypothetical protein